MKTCPKSLLIGFLLGALGLLAMGQTGERTFYGRYQGIADARGGIYVLDSTSGIVKLIEPIDTAQLGQPFEMIGRVPPQTR